MGSPDDRRHRSYLTEDVEESLTSILEIYPECSEETVRAVFQAECEKFEELFSPDAPVSAIQNVALNQTKKRLRDGDLPETVKQSD